MQTIFDIIGTFLLIVAVGIIVYYGLYFYGTLTEKKEKD
jgi:hypothetical protein